MICWTAMNKPHKMVIHILRVLTSFFSRMRKFNAPSIVNQANDNDIYSTYYTIVY